ncbi:MAG: hypothetical protein KAT20_07855 [Desulfuromonadales bacterium]|nr:hypothetical protein [Desulfuromonadales bacterium]NOQ51377.1 hypothetical protein [Desulfuromonadaceae bacterium]
MAGQAVAVCPAAYEQKTACRDGLQLSTKQQKYTVVFHEETTKATGQAKDPVIYRKRFFKVAELL